MTWGEVRKRLDNASQSALDSEAICSCDPTDRDPEDGFRYFGIIDEMVPESSPSGLITGYVASFTGEPNDQNQGPRNEDPKS
jgi:hypothetical protein